MEIKKPNDILIATLSNPEATPYDLLSRNITGENTSLLSKDDYKKSNYIQDTFKDEDGKFDEVAFGHAYDLAQNNYYNLTNQEYLEDLNKVEYSPFDITRPKLSQTFSVSATMEKEDNPFEVRKGWAGIDSVIESPLSLRELAQKGKVHDLKTNTWSEKSLNDLGLLDKLFGDTNVYAQWDDEGVHTDPSTGYVVNHKKGDWKFDDNGALYTEKLGDREVYGKQVVNSMDILTTDGSLMDQFNFLDSDGREKAMAGTVFKVAAEIAPIFIPGVGQYYGGVRAAVGLASVLPTFYKAFEGMLLGDDKTSLTKSATALEGWMSKLTTNSVSDEASGSMFSFEQMSSMVSDIFTQIYEQRAMAGLSKRFMQADKMMDAKTEELAKKINTEVVQKAIEGQISFDDIKPLSRAAMSKIPELQSVIERQSQLSKALSLGYMALTSTSDIYGEAINSGYDRRTAGFAALASAAGQYSVMMNNRMGDWFLDETTGYSKEVNNALMRKAILPKMGEVEEIFSKFAKNPEAGKKALDMSLKGIKNSIYDTFTTPSILGEAMWKNAVIEGVEEVTEQAVLDATKGMIDTMSYLGMTKKKGSFGGWQNVFSEKGAQTYLANLVGGVIGGGLFEFQNTKIEPLINPGNISPLVQKDLYELVAAGHSKKLIEIVNKERKRLGNKFISPLNEDGSFKQADGNSISQADVIADRTIDMINMAEGILNSYGFIQSDEEIVRKAIRDKITIDKMRNATPNGSTIGLEGLALEDVKTKMVQIASLQSQITSLETNPENLAAAVKGNPNVVENLKTELKLHVNDVNDILEGKSASKYFGKANLYLNKRVNKAFMNVDRASYAQSTYGVNYSDLSEIGSLGELSKQRIDKEWENYVNSADLKKNLNTAYDVYTTWEKLVNPYIANFVESGYSEEFKKTATLIKDLEATTKAFNTSDPKNKLAILERYTAINNELEKLKVTLVPAWEVYHNDMFDQLNNLDLIKKLKYSDELGNPEIIEDLKKEDIEETKEAKGFITNYFKQFPMNPLNAEGIISNFNSEVDQTNRKKLAEIAKITSKQSNGEILTEQDQQKLEELNNSLINIKIGSLENTPLIKGHIEGANSQIKTILDNAGITEEKFNKYKEFKQSEDLYKYTPAELLSEFNETDWKNLSKEGLNGYLYRLSESGLFDTVLEKLSESYHDIESVLSESMSKLDNENLSNEELNEVKDNLTEFFNVLNTTINDGKAIVNNEDYGKVQKSIDNIYIELKEKINKAKPEILKLNNHAFDLILDGLNSGILDKELYNEGAVMFKEELNNILSNLFPEASSIKNMSGTEVLPLLENIFASLDKFNENLESEQRDANNGSDELTLDYLATLETALNNQKGILNANPTNYKGFFVSKEFLDFIDNNFDKDTRLEDLKTELYKAKSIYESSKPQLKKLEQFNKIGSEGAKLKSNAILDFIRNLSLTLNSNPDNKVNKILDILAKEETLLKSSSNITNYMAEGATQSDLQQAADTIDLILSVVHAMSTTTVDYDDPVGFIYSRQKFAKQYNPEDEVLGLKTITSDMAELMSLDLEKIKTKLLFLKDLTLYNSGKMVNEQEIIHSRVENILLDNWSQWCKKGMNPSFMPSDKIQEVLSSKESPSKKLMLIENLIFEKNINSKKGALEEFMKEVKVNSHDSIPMDKEVTSMSSWDLIIYFATVLSTRSQDIYTRNYKTINGNFTKAPFFTQEFAARILKAATAEPILFDDIIEIKQDSSNLNCGFITLVSGGAGTGKTSAVFGLLLDNLRQTNKNSIIWLSAPGDLSLKALENGIENSVGKEGFESTSFMKSQLFTRLGIGDLVDEINKELSHISNEEASKDNKYIILDGGSPKFTEEITNLKWIDDILPNLENLPNLLMIDEVTHYSSFELYLLNAISKYSYQNESLNFMKIVAAGDPSQMGKLLEITNEKGTKYYNYNINKVNLISAPRLWASVRSSNNQKRINSDRLNRIMTKINYIYDHIFDGKTQKEAEENTDAIYEEAAQQVYKYLEATAELNLLSYYENNETINGESIIKSLDLATINKLKNIVKNDSSAIIGILTEDGNLPEEWNKMLTDAGLILPTGDSPNIKLFNPNNIQGSEVDYFIFDTNLTKKYDKLRDNFRAFYTYVSRSKKGTIIIDSEEILQNEYKLENGKKDIQTITFDPLTETVIKLAKERKSKDILELIGENATPSKYDNFKWKGGTESLDFESDTEEGRYVGPISKEITELDLETSDYAIKEEEKNAKLAEEFKVMFHSFYNNPNAKINDDGSITVNTSNGNFDLNTSESSDADEAKLIIKDWLNLKSKLNYNKPTSIKSSEYTNYLKKVFVELNEGTTELIDVEYVLTVRAFDEKINKPYAKEGYKKESLLKKGDLFINLSAKLTLGDKVHYITLATLGSKEKIDEAAKTYNYDISKITARFDDLKDKLSQSSDGMLELKINDLSKVNFSTKTRLEKPKTDKGKQLEYDLTSLSEKFPNLNISEIRIFPTDKIEFENLVNKYTFGTKRKEAMGTKRWDQYHDGLKGQTYIVVSYDNDLEGSDTSSKTQATIIPIGAHLRGLQEITKEVKEIIERRNAQKLTKEGVDDVLNAQTETLLHRSDILNVLIKWGLTYADNSKTKTLLDLLDKEITFSLNDETLGTKTSVFEIFSQFGTYGNSESRKLSVENFKSIITKIKKEIAKNSTSKLTEFDLQKKIKWDLLPSIKGVKYWHWTFFNIFAYEQVIDSVQDEEFGKLVLKGLFNENIESFTNSEGSKEMKKTLALLMNAIKDEKFYYSVPIKVVKGTGQRIINPLISGKNGFKKEMFGDKFFINVAPEPARILMGIDEFLNAGVVNENTDKSEVAPVIKPTKKTTSKKTTPTAPKEKNGIQLSEVSNAKDLHSYILNDLSSLSDESKSNLNTVLEAIFRSEIMTDELIQNFKNILEVRKGNAYSDRDNIGKIETLLETMGIAILEDSVRGKSIDRKNIEEVLKIQGKEVIEIRKNIMELLKQCK